MKQELQPKNQKSSKVGLLALALIIAVQCIVMIFLFVYQKNIYFTDEYYTYGISNSFKQPFLFADDYFGFLNSEEASADSSLAFHIKTGDDFKYYLRTNPETAFRYDSVWYNASLDTTPPLYYIFLHTLCSIDPGHFSWYDGLILNMICLVITQIFVYLLTYQISRSQWTACLTVAFWGFTLGCISCFTFIRMYSMLTMFCMIYTYQTVSLHQKESPTWKTYGLIVLSIFLGALTHHNFLVYSFFCTAVSCLFLLLQKNFKKFFSYGFSALGGVLLSILVFPATINHLTMAFPWTGDPSDTNDGIFFHALLKNALCGSMTINTDWWLFIKAAAIVIIPICAVLLVVFHRKPFVRKLPEKGRQLANMLKIKFTDPYAMHPGGFILILTVFLYFFMIVKMTFFWDLLEPGVRYMYIIMPPLVILPLSTIELLIRKRHNAIKIAVNSVLGVGLAALLVYQHSVENPVFLIKTDITPQEVAALTEDHDCVVLIDSIQNEQCLSDALTDANTVVVSLSSEKQICGSQLTEAICGIADKQQPFMVLLDVSNIYTEAQRQADIEAKKESKSLFEDKLGSEFKVLMDDAASDKYSIDVSDVDSLQSESGIIKYLEETTGYSAVKVCETQNQNLGYYVFRFMPSAEENSLQ